jgi:hypothetical protein
MLRITKDNSIFTFVLTAVLCAMSSLAVSAQTSAFTYQWKLKDVSSPANGQYDFTFKLYEQSGGQVASAVQRDDVTVTNGVFSVSLDFGAGTFDGGARLLEIGVRPGSSTGAFTMLAPKQPVTSAPYAVRSLNAASADTALNATQLGGVTANQFVQTDDTRLSDARNPLPNSPSYIQNATTPQPMANFNIGGIGTGGGTMSTLRSLPSRSGKQVMYPYRGTTTGMASSTRECFDRLGRRGSLAVSGGAGTLIVGFGALTDRPVPNVFVR